MSESKLLLNAAALQRALARIAHQIAEKNEDSTKVVVVGIQKGGVHLAARLGELLAKIWNHPVPVGLLDIGLYRDDLDEKISPHIQPTEMPFDVQNKTVVLVDDVIFSGRSTRAALDALIDFGRPKAIQLAVLIDRGHRELPIHPDFVAKVVPTALSERVSVNLIEIGGADTVTLEKK